MLENGGEIVTQNFIIVSRVSNSEKFDISDIKKKTFIWRQ